MHYIPNILTILRLFLVVLIAWMLLRQEFETALWLFVIAALSDALDGFLARAYSWTSRFGAFADPMADKFMINGTALALIWVGAFPLWLFVVMLSRDLSIALAIWLHYRLAGPVTFAASIIGKIYTVLVIVVIILVLVSRIEKYEVMSWVGIFVAPGYWLIAILALITGGHYIILGLARGLAMRRAKHFRT